MKRLAVFGAAMALVSASSAFAQEPGRITLRCIGQGSHPVDSTSQLTARNTSGDTVSAQINSIQVEKTNENFLIEIAGADSRIRWPKALLPLSHFKAQDGWWPLSDVVMSDDEITGSFRLNLLRKPAVTIDRRTGDINVRSSDGYGFRGTCAPEVITERKF